MINRGETTIHHALANSCEKIFFFFFFFASNRSRLKINTLDLIVASEEINVALHVFVLLERAML